jgi:hypothetical protein
MEVGPEVEIAGDELTAVVDADRLREPRFGADTVERRDDVPSSVAEPRIDRRREPRPGFQGSEQRIARERDRSNGHRRGAFRVA